MTEVNIINDAVSVTIVDEIITVNVIELPLGGSLQLGETSTTAYRGDRGKTAYDHSQISGNPHNTQIIYNIGSLIDGAGISVDALNNQQAMASLITSTTAIALSLANLGKVLDISIYKTTASNIVLTITGTGLTFVNMEYKAGNNVITLVSAINTYFELSFKDSGMISGGNRIIYISYR